MNLIESGNAKVRISKEDDIAKIASDMRKSDIEEVWASHHLTPEAALSSSFKESDICLTVTIDDEPVAMFGTAPVNLLGSQAAVWLLATNKFCCISKRFLKRSRAFIKAMLEKHPHLINFVDVRNTPSIKWLKFCGARFGPVIPYGAEGLNFQYFEFKGDL